MAPQCPADFQRALDGCVRCRRKYESYAVSGCNSNQFTGGFRTPKRLGVSDYLIKVLEQLMLLIDQSFRIPDDVYEQDMGNLQSKIGFRFGHKLPTVLLTEERATLNGDRTPDAQMIKVYRLGNNIVRDPSTALRMIKSCQGGELNSRPRAYESPALPLSYPGKIERLIFSEQVGCQSAAHTIALTGPPVESLTATVVSLLNK